MEKVNSTMLDVGLKAVEAEFKIVGRGFKDRKSDIEERHVERHLLSLLTLARRIYLAGFAFDRDWPLVTSFPCDKILPSLRIPVKRAMDMDGMTPTYQRVLGQIVKDLYANPKIFALAIVSYFEAHLESFPGFVNLTFPALYGFFLTEELTTFAHDFLDVILQIPNLKMKFAFLRSFFASAQLFLRVFWRLFFELLAGFEGIKPSVAQLSEMLITVLQSSIQYLSSAHIQIAIAFLSGSPSDFMSFFFEGFLLDYFDAWVDFNSSIVTSPVTRGDMIALFEYLNEDSARDGFMSILELFARNVFTFCELIASQEFGEIAKHLIVLSPSESTGLMAIVSSIPSISTRFPRRLTAIEGESLSPFFIEIYANDKNVEPHYEPLLFPPRSLQPVSATDAHNLLLNRVKCECAENGIDELSIIANPKVALPSDTFYAKEIKASLPPLDGEFLAFVRARYLNEKIRFEYDCEQFFLRFNIAQEFDEIQKRLRYHQLIMEQRFLSQLSSRSIPS
jgi:hypothetical protein